MVAAASVLLLVVTIGWRIENTFGAKTPAANTATVVIPNDIPANGADWQQEMLLLGLATTSDPSAMSENDPISMIGPVVVAQLVGEYAGLLENNAYTQATGEQAALSIANNVRAAISYKTYAFADLKTDPDVSYKRMLQYRSDLRDALAPLLDNKEAELEVYGKYIETSDPTYLTKLSAAAKNYKKASEQTAAMTIPRDAVNYHLDILNAMQQFAATIEAMATHGTDTFGSVALLRNYNSAEQRMFLSFDALSSYYGQKTP